MKLVYKEKIKQRSVLSVLKDKLFVSSRLIKKNKGNIKINNNMATVNDVLNKGDVLIFDIKEEKTSESFINKYSCDYSELNILFEDEYLLIVDKPSGVHIHPSMMDTEKTLANSVAVYLASQGIYGIHIVTRLDKGTSGICVFAKNAYIQELFIKKKKQVEFYKEYLAVVNGIINKSSFVIEEPIARKDDSIIIREVNSLGQYAKTDVEVKNVNIEKDYSVVKIVLHTGRTHQIRVHMSHIGHPLLGDSLYSNGLTNICNNIIRPALHCKKIKFIHPVTEKSMSIESEIPTDILNILCN